MNETKKNGIEPSGYETSDANTGFLVKFGVSLLMLTAVALGLMFTMLSWFDSQRAKAETEPHQLAAESQLPSGLRLQVTPEHDYAVFNASQDSILNSYGWIQQEAGVVRIPIDSAMSQLLQRGLPARQNSTEEQ